ncbi:hypothetical protein L6452_17154 [Arctium lappa]|uniref:Uncharacterized protein n=1 Tax=Arctium lappa TaxID=4217 RepID=A0ACB9C2W7_ARCLA|nr:hypothetical protein L6452_17154 [Arctium lappa]
MASAPDFHAYLNCIRIWALLNDKNALDFNDLELVHHLCGMIYVSEEAEAGSRPMLWIGIYIAVASLFCILLMAADLFHGFRNRKLWFPSKYFTLNAASITVITIAMKLPVDLSGLMPGPIDQLTKAGSMTFMCTMMANLMPSLASMDNRELFTNVAGLVPLGIVIIGVLCVHCWKSLKSNFFAMRVASNRETTHVTEQNDTNEDIGKYALQLQDEVELESIVFHAWGDVGRRIHRLDGMSVIKHFQDDLFFFACYN